MTQNVRFIMMLLLDFISVLDKLILAFLCFYGILLGDYPNKE